MRRDFCNPSIKKQSLVFFSSNVNWMNQNSLNFHSQWKNLDFRQLLLRMDRYWWILKRGTFCLKLNVKSEFLFLFFNPTCFCITLNEWACRHILIFIDDQPIVVKNRHPKMIWWWNFFIFFGLGEIGLQMEFPLIFFVQRWFN